MAINIGNITGLSIGGSRQSTAGFASTTVGGVKVSFQPGENLATRQVNIGGNISLTVGPGFSQSMQINGLDVRSQNGQLWVNGQKVDFAGKEVPAEAKKTAQDELTALQSKYPGVTFSGSPGATRIDDSVQIAAGAYIELNPGLQLIGDTKIAAGARITGGTISDSTVAGEVQGGTVERSELAAKARVAGGSVERSVLRGGATVNGGNVERSTLEEGATVNGGNVERMTLGARSTVNGGNLERFNLPAGKTVNHGNHDGALSESRGPTVNVGTGGVQIGGSGGVFIGGNITGTVVVGDVIQGLRMGNFDAQTTSRMAAFSKVAGDLNVVINAGDI